jgi:UDP-N-acetylmuramoyl-tripeptide--D-alanyl-D-alanine ligase
MAFLAPGPVITFGFDSAARVTGYDLGSDETGHLVLTVEDQELPQPVEIRTELVGEQLGINILAALAAAIGVGVPFQRAAAALQGVRPVSPHRMAVTDLAGGITLIDDSYNASPDSMAAAIKTVAERARREGREATAVLGGMLELGAASQAEHRAVGELVAREGYSRLIVAGEEARGVYDGALAAGFDRQNAQFYPSVTVERLTTYLVTALPSGLVLLKASHGTGLWRVAEDLALRLRLDARDAAC